MRGNENASRQRAKLSKALELDEAVAPLLQWPCDDEYCRDEICGDDYPSRTTIEHDGLIFSSNFCSGNMARCDRVVETDGSCAWRWGIWTAPDCVGTEFETTYRTWFYFSVSGAQSGQVLRFCIMNMNNQVKLYKNGYRPITRSLPSNPIWRRIEKAPTWRKLKKKNDSGVQKMNESFMELRWETTVRNSSDTIFFAFCYPYSYEDTLLKLRGIDLRYQPCQCSTNTSPKSSEESKTSSPSPSRKEAWTNDIYYHREVLTKSIEGRRVDVLTISSMDGITTERHPVLENCFPDASAVSQNMQAETDTLQNSSSMRAFKFVGKKTVYISSRVHPGESPASFFFDGLLELLLRENDERSIALRRSFVFVLVPLLNPDGVARGHYRADSRGINLNRCYKNPDPKFHPTIYASRQLLMHHSQDKGCPLFAFIDLHAHATKRGCFMFGNHLPTLQDQVNNVLFAQLVALNSLFLDPLSCSFEAKNMIAVDKRGDSKDGCGRVGIYNLTKCNHCYTLEANYNNGSRMLNTIPDASNDDGRASPGRSCRVTNRKKKMSKQSAESLQYGIADWMEVGGSLGIAILDFHGLNPWSRSFFNSVIGLFFIMSSPQDLDVAAAYNKVRRDPMSFVALIEEKLKYLSDDGRHFKFPGSDVLIVCKEGRAVYEEASAFLKAQAPVPELTTSYGMTLAARDHCLDQGSKGLCGHNGTDGSSSSDRISRYGEWAVTTGENIDFGGGKTAEDVVLALIVDDGVPDRGHRKNVFNESFRRIGCAEGMHTEFQRMYCQVFAGEYNDFDRDVQDKKHTELNDIANDGPTQSTATENDIANDGPTPSTAIESKPEKKKSTRKFKVRSPKKTNAQLKPRRKFIVARQPRNGESIDPEQTSPSRGIRRHVSGNVVPRSILGKPKHFEKALAEVEGDDESQNFLDAMVTATRSRAVGVGMMKSRLKKARSALQVTDPLVLLEREQETLARRNKALISRAKNCRKTEEEEHEKKLSKMLPHIRLAHDRQTRMLRLWKKRQDGWNKWKRNTAHRVGKSEADLVVSRAEDYRAMLEEYDLVNKALPKAEKQGSDFWMMSLRNDGTRYVPVGNIFSGLFCPIKDDDKTLPIVVRKPGMAKPEASWRDSHQLKQRKQQLAHKLQSLRPHEVDADHAMGLIVSGSNLFEWAAESTQNFYTHSIRKLRSAQSVQKSQHDRDGDGFDDETGEKIVTKQLVGPQIRISIVDPNGRVVNNTLHTTKNPKSVINLMMEEDAGRKATATVRFENTGSTAIFFSWKTQCDPSILANDNMNTSQRLLERKSSSRTSAFASANLSGVVLPGQTKDVAITFCSKVPGIFREVWQCTTKPTSSKLNVLNLWLCGVALKQKFSEVQRQQVVDRFHQRTARGGIEDIITGVVERIKPRRTKRNDEKEMRSLRRDTFEANNPGLFYSPNTWKKFDSLFERLSSILQIPKKQADWDCNVATLRKMIDEVQYTMNDSTFVDKFTETLEKLVEDSSQHPFELSPYYEAAHDAVTNITSSATEALVVSKDNTKNSQEEVVEANTAVEEASEEIPVTDTNMTSSDGEKVVDPAVEAAVRESWSAPLNEFASRCVSIAAEQRAAAVSTTHGSLFEKRSVLHLTKEDIDGKTVLVRTDLNVALASEDSLAPEAAQKFARAVPTIKMLLEKGALRVLLLTHLEYAGEPVSTECLVSGLEDELELDVKFVNACVGEEVTSEFAEYDEGAVFLLQNIAMLPADWRFKGAEKERNYPAVDDLANVVGVFESAKNESTGVWTIYEDGCAITPGGEETKVRLVGQNQLVLPGGGGLLKLHLGKRNYAKAFTLTENGEVYTRRSSSPPERKKVLPLSIVELEEGVEPLFDENELPAAATAREVKALKTGLSKLADIFVLDALSICGGNSVSSNVECTNGTKPLAGLMLVEEMKHAAVFLENPGSPMVVIAGGKPTRQRMNMLCQLLGTASHILLGGHMALAVMLAQRSETMKDDSSENPVNNEKPNRESKPFVDDDRYNEEDSNDDDAMDEKNDDDEEAGKTSTRKNKQNHYGATKVNIYESFFATRQFLREVKRHATKLVLPTDFVVGDEKTRPSNSAVIYDGDTQVVQADQVSADGYILDIGKKTKDLYISEIVKAECVVMIGGMGEIQYDDAGRIGTIALLEAMSPLTKVGKPTMVCGWELESLISELGIENSVSLVSDGASATVKLLSGETLPGLSALSTISEGEVSLGFTFTPKENIEEETSDNGNEVGTEN
eukprot:g293.t1